METVEILTIGNEVLNGQVLDTNSHWLCQQVAAGGGQVRRITVLPDVSEVVGEALRGALERRPAVIVTCGGLGPTVDDLTVSAVGVALGRPMREDATAYGMVSELYRRLHAAGDVSTAEMTSARAKMAQLPEGAIPLPNRVGAAPGVWIEQAGVIVACLPGVPAEMKDIWTNALWPRLRERFGQPEYGERSVVTKCWDESILAPIVDGVTARHERVYVKSRAQVYGSGKADFVTLTATGKDKAEVDALLEAAEKDLRRALADAGIEVE